MSDNRQFPEHLADLTEEERFEYFLGRATKELHSLDAAQVQRNRIRAMAGPDDPAIEEPEERAARLVRILEQVRRDGPPKAAKGETEEERERNLEALVAGYQKSIASLEAEIGRRNLIAWESRDGATPNAMRKAKLESLSTKRPARTLYRRVVIALTGEFRSTGRIPTKGELFDALERYPVSDVEVFVELGQTRVTYRTDGEPEPVDRRDFRAACNQLGLGELLSGEPGNPEFSKGGNSE